MVSILTKLSIMYLSCAWQNFWLAFPVLSACAVSKGAIQRKKLLTYSSTTYKL